MAFVVYVLCAVTSIGCAILLLRNYTRRRVRLLFWSALCFVCLGVSNIILFVDLAILPTTIDLSIYRNIATLAGLVMLLYGLIWEAK